MSVEENIEVVRRYFEEFMNRGNKSVLSELMAEDYVMHLPNGQDAKGIEASIKGQANRKAAFPDLSVIVEEMVAENDKVVTLGKWQGTHTGDYHGIPPTGKQFGFAFTVISRLENGKLAEGRLIEDTLSFYRQIGVTPQID